jgi:hypothetical protein
VSPGLTVRSRQPDGRRSGGTGLRGTSTQDTRQRRTDRSGTRTIGRLGQTPTPKGGVGQPSSALDTPALRTRRAANAARVKETGKPTATPPKRTPGRVAQIRQQSRATSQGARATRGMSDSEVKALQNKYNKELPTSPTTHFNGEVRLQGSKYSMDPQAKNLVDGSVSRTIGSTKGQGRSSEASAAAKKTMEAVKARKAKRQAANRVLRGTVPSRVTNNRQRVRGTGTTRRLQRSLSGLLKRRRAR